MKRVVGVCSGVVMSHSRGVGGISSLHDHTLSVLDIQDQHDVTKHQNDHSSSPLSGSLPGKCQTETYTKDFSPCDWSVPDGLPHGISSKIFADSTQYVGSFAHGDMHGTGVFTTINGSVYTGSFSRHKRHGYGVLIYPDGDRYDGGYLTGKGLVEASSHIMMVVRSVDCFQFVMAVLLRVKGGSTWDTLQRVSLPRV